MIEAFAQAYKRILRMSKFKFFCTQNSNTNNSTFSVKPFGSEGRECTCCSVRSQQLSSCSSKKLSEIGKAVFLDWSAISSVAYRAKPITISIPLESIPIHRKCEYEVFHRPYDYERCHLNADASSSIVLQNKFRVS